jgi:hypothetical protein
MAHLAGGGADALAGHMHLGSISRTVMRYSIARHSALVMQAEPPAPRAAGEHNSFNRIRVDPGSITIERWAWSAERLVFSPAGSESFRKTDDGWEPLL